MRIADEKRRREERQRRRLSGLPTYSSEWSLSSAGSGFVARRQGYCQICRELFERGETIRPVGRGRYAHWSCVEAELAKRASVRSVVGSASRLSQATELRRRVFWSVACPECGAGVGAGCLTPNGGRRVRNHVQRVLAYSKAKRARAVVADGDVLARLREVVARSAVQSGREAFVPAFADIPEVDSFDVALEWVCVRT